jgi:hypothetical protein
MENLKTIEIAPILRSLESHLKNLPPTTSQGQTITPPTTVRLHADS